METSQCIKCGINKSVEEFYKNKNKKKGISNYCKKCDSEFAKLNRKKNSKKIRKIEGTKLCGYCNLIKDATEFVKNKNNVRGIGNICKECQKQKNKEFRSTEEGKKYNSKYQKEYRKKNPEKVKNRYTNYRKNHPEKAKQYRERKKEDHKEYAKNYRLKNKEKLSEKAKEYNRINKGKRREQNRIYQKKRRSENTLIKLMTNIRARVFEYLKYKKISKRNTTLNIVGCSRQELKVHLEKQFKHGMTWENHNFYGWHIDHIIPLSSAKDEEELYKLFYYTNLQPLWAEENYKKGNKII